MVQKLFLIIFISAFILITGCDRNNNADTKIVIGSKTFTESVILGEIISQFTKSQGAGVEYRKELGGTRVLWNALVNGDIDVYPEYSGTITEEILSGQNITDEQSLNRELGKYGIKSSRPLGFNNTYAIGMRKDTAQKLGIEKLSDLRKHAELRFGFSNEFMDRGDGWPSLQNTYNLPQQNVTGLDHDLAYRGLESGDIDVIDLYSTDAEIEYYDLKIIKDDLNHFPEYNSVILYRNDIEIKNPGAMKAILALEGSITEETMMRMNSEAKISGQSEIDIASGFLKNHLSIERSGTNDSFLKRLYRNTIQHLFLVAVSLCAAIMLSIPLGIIAYKKRPFGKLILGTVGVIQTIPSLALLVFMIPFFGIGTVPAILALFLYSLLPIVRNTYLGLEDITPEIRESAIAMGLSSSARLRLIEIPLASRSIISGIKTSAVINVGTATLGALIGAGGYGQPILTGIRLDNVGLILEGAIPAAALALLVQLGFDMLERIMVPKGLRLVA